MPTKKTGEYASPRGLIPHLGGVSGLELAARDGDDAAFLRRLCHRFTEAYYEGLERRWTTQESMATALGVSLQFVKRFMAGRHNKPHYVAGMKYADLHRIAEALNIPLEDLWRETHEGPHAVAAVVCETRAARRQAGEGLSERDLSEEEIKVVVDLIERCDGGNLPLWWGRGDFGEWVSRMLAAMTESDPPLDLSGIDRTGDLAELTELVVAAGDWLELRLSLSTFIDRLFGIAKETADDPEISPALREDAKALMVGLLTINRLLTAFRMHRNEPLEKVAKELGFPRIAAVHTLLERVELDEADFRERDAALGQLIMTSNLYRPKMEALLASVSRYGLRGVERRPPKWVGNKTMAPCRRPRFFRHWRPTCGSARLRLPRRGPPPPVDAVQRALAEAIAYHTS